MRFFTVTHTPAPKNTTCYCNQFFFVCFVTLYFYFQVILAKDNFTVGGRGREVEKKIMS